MERPEGLDTSGNKIIHHLPPPSSDSVKKSAQSKSQQLKQQQQQQQQHRPDKRERDDEHNSKDNDYGDSDRFKRKKVERKSMKKKKHSRKSSSKRTRYKDRDKRSRRSRRSRGREQDNSSTSSANGDSSSSSSSISDTNTDGSDENDSIVIKTTKIVNERLLAKLHARGETLEERKERRAQARADHISSRFGYTNEVNPFNDTNLGETFVWKKKQQSNPKDKVAVAKGVIHSTSHNSDTLEEIEKVRQRRKERELQLEDMERIRAEESRMKELENYDEWARKDEEFHLQQQRQRSAIRLVEGREKPIDVLAKNVLLYGLSDEEKQNRGAAVKYKERFNAMESLENLEAELIDPQSVLKVLKLDELRDLLDDICAFQTLEREACASLDRMGVADSSTVLRYWNALYVIAVDETKYLQTSESKESHAKMVSEVQKIFKNQSTQSLLDMRRDVQDKIQQKSSLFDASFDLSYWQSVGEQLGVVLAKHDLTEIHNQMLVRQIERLHKRREEPSHKTALVFDDNVNTESANKIQSEVHNGVTLDSNVNEDIFDETEEVELQAMTKKYSWQDKYRPRKPRYFNRVKTGYDWNKYNQTHYDRDNPPPKVVQGYKFNIFYPELIDPTKTPQFFLEPADAEEFCIIRFCAGPPYEDVAFKIINREWNRSRKQGYKCTFERGVLSLYFNFTTHWYRR